MENRFNIKRLGIFFSVVLLIFCSTGYAGNIDPDIDGSKYAWGENIGWKNFEPSSGPGVTVTDSTVEGYAWGENIGWLSLSCANSSSCGTVSYGVTNDGIGNLSGYAWGENVGWINFAPTGAGVTIDPDTGVFSGYAWGENIGWINFAPTSGGVKTSWSGVSNGSGGGGGGCFIDTVAR